jgi:hypothetical protein
MRRQLAFSPHGALLGIFQPRHERFATSVWRGVYFMAEAASNDSPFQITNAKTLPP